MNNKTKKLFGKTPIVKITKKHKKLVLETRFKEAFPEFSTSIITWFRKHKHWL